MTSLIDITGQIFGRLTVLKKGPTRDRTTTWVCECKCGNYTTVLKNNLTSGNTISCGCYNADVVKAASTTHGMRHTQEYNAWAGMKNRCNNDPRYIKRKINVCKKWINNFQSFYDDIGPRPSAAHSIDRINNDGNYEPDNCRWATATQQAQNRRKTSKTSSGIVGVYWNKKQSKWVARITANKQVIYLGCFTVLSEAITAREKAELKYWSKVC